MEKIKKWLPWFLLFAWPLFLFRDLLTSISNSLIDWDDSAYIAWQIFMVRDKILTLSWHNLATLNTHYPFPMSTFFSDSFIGQAIITIPLFFVRNPILLYNLLFFITIFLNYYSSYLFFRTISKNPKATFLSIFFFNNSFFFFDQLIHLQTLCYFPTLFMLYFLNNKSQKKLNRLNYLKAGLSLALQFYFSIYLGIFALFIFGIYAVTKIIWELGGPEKIYNLRNNIVNLSIGTIIAIIIIYPLYAQYHLFEQIYHQVRDINEILLNSTHLTDFIFFIPKTLLANLGPVLKYQAFNRHLSAESIHFPGFILVIGVFLGLFFQKKITNKKDISFINKYNFTDLFFAVLLLTGIIFSLGPRLNANGQYLEIPLPYLIFLNKIFVFSSIRLVHRWIFLTLLALIYFSVKFYKQLNYRFLFIICIFFIFEAVPLNIKVTKEKFYDQGHQYLTWHAKPNETLMEFPFLNLEKGIPVDYETKILLASTKHKLNLFNGYTGFFINDWAIAKITFENFFPDKHTLNLLKNLEINYLKLNKPYLLPVKIKQIKQAFKKYIVFENSETIIFKLPLNLKIINTNNQISKERVNFIKTNPLTFGNNDNLIYLRLNYINKQLFDISNLKQRLAKIEFYFYRRNQQIKKQTYYDLYPLFIAGLSQNEHLIKFKETSKFDQVKVLLYSDINSQKPTAKLTIQK